MIGKCAKTYCKDDISLIENYAKAIADSTQMWDCHHRRENISSRKELIEKNEYYNRPARELIFLTKSEHRALHHKGKTLSEETKRKLSESHKNISEETKRKLSIAHQGKNTWIKGKHHSEEAKQKISIALQGKPTWNKGKHHSEETKRKISIAKKNMSEETKRKLSIAKKGMKLSEETKQKMAYAMKRLHWFNNGIKNVRAKSCPEGFVRGRIKK